MLERVDEKLPQGVLRFGNREAVQVDLALHAILAAAQPAQHPELHLRAMKDELLTACQRRVGAFPNEALLQHGGAVGAREARARPDLRRTWRRSTRPKRPDTAHGLPEQTRLVRLVVRVLIAWGSHASSAARLSDSIVTRTFGGSIPYAVKILVSNDDGFRAEGIRRLREALATLAEVTVVAPDRNKSGASNSLTLDVPLRVFESEPGVYFVPGTPTDCVHLAISGLFDFEHDMVVSGVNDGANLGDDVLYSGTVAAAVEGRFLGLPTIAVSLCTGTGTGGGHFESGAEVARLLVAHLLKSPLQSALILNVNVPDVPFAQLRGFRASRLGFRHRSEPVMRAQDPRGRPVYWIGSAGAEHDAGPGTDFDTVAQGYVSVTPLQVDLTRHAALSAVGTWLAGIND